MTSKEPILNLTYPALLEKTEALLQSAMSFQTGNALDDHDRGLRRGILMHWYHMAIETGGPQSQREADWKRLHLKAGLPVNADTNE